MCEVSMPDDSPLTTPFEYAENEYPRPYATICKECHTKFSKGELTKEQFLEVTRKPFADIRPITPEELGKIRGYIPEGYYFKDDLDGGRLVKKEL